MKRGFNWGQVFHALHLETGGNGFASEEFLSWIRKNYPLDMVKNVRFSGTMSNTMTLDTVGYNYPQHTQQLINQRKSQPTISYLIPFVDMFEKLKCESLSFTINTHVVFEEGDAGLNRMMEALEYVRSRVPINAIELENEGYLYRSLTGLSTGSPNLADRIALVGITNAARNSEVEKAVRDRVNSFLNCLELQVVPAIAPLKIPMGISIGNPTNMRERVWNQEVLKRSFYNFIVPHIYITPDSEAAMRSELEKRINAVRKPGTDIHVTEFNWNYQTNPAGPSDVRAFRENFFVNLERLSVKEAHFHCLSQGRGAYSWIQRA